MQGTVIHVRHRGVIITLDEAPEVGDIFQIYRVQNDTDIIIGQGYIGKTKGANEYKLNSMDNEDGSRGGPIDGVVVGDLVRKIAP